MGSTKMPISVLEHIRGDKISAEIEKSEGFKPDETYKVVFIPDSEIKLEPPKKKVYSDEVLEIAKEAKRRSDENKKHGKTRKESFKDFYKAQKEIEKYL